MATIFSIVYQPQDQAYGDRFDYFIRVPISPAKLIANHGIEGDDKAGRNPRRQLNILSYAWLMQRQKEGYKVEPGDFGEQLIIEGLDVENLPGGTQLQLGSDAIIEITFARTGCIRLDAAQGTEAVFAGADIGMLASVIKSGLIKVGDPVIALAKRFSDKGYDK
ncbi:MAG: MOSC domain-containing protein [Chloroflexota bacterium]